MASRLILLLVLLSGCGLVERERVPVPEGMEGVGEEKLSEVLGAKVVAVEGGEAVLESPLEEGLRVVVEQMRQGQPGLIGVLLAVAVGAGVVLRRMVVNRGEGKPVYRSKAVWLSVLMIVAGVLDGITGVLGTGVAGSILLVISGAVNAVIRGMTGEPVRG